MSDHPQATQLHGGMMLLPAKPGTCQVCATNHKENEPHNLQSLYYGVRFKGLYERDPTWFDCFAHLKISPKRVLTAANAVLVRFGRTKISMGQFPKEGAIAETYDGQQIGRRLKDGTFARKEES